MKRTILVLAVLVSLGMCGCDSQSMAKVILTVGINAQAVAEGALPDEVDDQVVATADQPAGSAPRATRRPRPATTHDLVTALGELRQLSAPADQGAEASPSLTELIERIAGLVTSLEQGSGHSQILVQQAREARAVALNRAAEMRPAEFLEARDTYCLATLGTAWDRGGLEKQAINRLVSGYLVAAKLPTDARPVLSLHAATFPHHAMNVELYTTIAERLASEQSLRQGLELAREGLQNCAEHSDVDRLRQRLKQMYRKHPGQIGVPMNFVGPSIRDRRFKLSSLRGRPVLVVFWSAIDPISDEFVVSCNELVAGLAATEVEVVGVCLDAKMADLELWYHTHGFPCHHVFSEEVGHEGFQNPIAKFYQVTAVPAYFLLDRDGIVVAQGPGDLTVIENEIRRLVPPSLADARR